MAQELPNGMSAFVNYLLFILPCIYSYMSWIYKWYRSVSYWTLKSRLKGIYKFINSFHKMVCISCMKFEILYLFFYLVYLNTIT
jgi:hypothetical protein